MEQVSLLILLGQWQERRISSNELHSLLLDRDTDPIAKEILALFYALSDKVITQDDFLQRASLTLAGGAQLIA